PDRSPLWTPDGNRIIFTSNRSGYPEMFWRSADGSGSDERLLGRAKDLLDLRANGWSADGRQLLFTEVPPSIQNSIGQMAIDRPSEANALVKSAFFNDFAAVSPDGGRMPVWSRDGRDLFFSTLDSRQMLTVPVQAGTTLVAGRPQVLFEFAMLLQ